MLTKKKQAEKFTIPGGTEGILYPSDVDGDFTIARVKSSGVYPEKGYSINNVATETIFLLSGSLKVEIEGEVFEVNEGDFISIKPGKKYRLEGDGESVDLITPAWEKNKNRIVEK